MVPLALLACGRGGDGTPPPPAGRVLEGSLLGAGLAPDGTGLWVTAPEVDGTGAVLRFDAPSGTLSPVDAAVSVAADGPHGLGASTAPCDFDGDGSTDLVVGAPDRDTFGGAWLVAGPLSDTVLGSQPFAAGIRADGRAGAVVACGDADGDAIAEIALSAPDSNGFGVAVAAGSIGLHRAVAGGTVEKIANFDTTFSDSHLGFRSALLLGPDLDGDGVGDLAIGGWGADKVHVVFGPLAGSYDANSAGPMFDGEDGEGTGYALAAGDLDGDGASDLLIGTPLAAGDAGGAWILGGPFTGDDDGLIRNRGSQVYGVQPGDQAGFAVAAVPDADGDGDGELLVGAPFAGGVGPEAGAAYLVLGPGGEGDLDTADALLLGEVAHGRLGWAVAAAAGMLYVSAPESDVGGVIGAGSVFGWRDDVRGTVYPDAAASRIVP